jgi:hypothetical protein
VISALEAVVKLIALWTGMLVIATAAHAATPAEDLAYARQLLDELSAQEQSRLTWDGATKLAEARAKVGHALRALTSPGGAGAGEQRVQCWLVDRPGLSEGYDIQASNGRTVGFGMTCSSARQRLQALVGDGTCDEVVQKSACD